MWNNWAWEILEKGTKAIQWEKGKYQQKVLEQLEKESLLLPQTIKKNEFKMYNRWNFRAKPKTSRKITKENTIVTFHIWLF